MEYIIREGTVEDSIGIARVNLQTWQKSYREFFPAEQLDNYSISDTAKKWRSQIESFNKNQIKLLVAEDNHHKIVGFATGGPAGLYDKSGIHDYDCEIYAIYVLNEQQNKGIGESLLKNMMIIFSKNGWKSMIIWTLKDSPYRRFYEKLRGIPRETQRYFKWGTEHTLSGFVWKDINFLYRKSN